MDLREFLKSRFDKDKFIEFLSHRFYGFEANIAGDEFLGSVKLDDRKEIGFFVFKIDDNKDIENARVSYNTELKDYAKEYMLDSAIGVFYNSKDVWRLSFIRFSYDDKNKQQVSNLKKFTFVLGIPAINTAYNQLKELKYPNTKALESAFGVEKVSNEFFAKYRGLFERLNENISDQMALFGNEDGLHAFSKKLLGRIVFLYFLQKKGWLGVPKGEQWGDGDRNFVSNLFKKNSKEFYAKKLSPLFFDTLNQQRPNDYSDIFDCRIPFLNGGLFDKNAAYDERIFIGDEIFGEIFDTFDGYNFTIIEDSSDESEVAIDPEMLGRVFENLLEENYRKGKGAFYTPREIVGYMCRQSIKEKLIQTFEKEWIERLINKQETDNPYIRKNANEIKQAVLNIKVLDPAIGSGAFPMGMLQTMIEMLSNIDKAADKAQLKRSVIENSIYGVDIDSDAVEIAKLRFWLSLTVDEESPSPLPNLDFKIMQGNSLIETINGFSPIPPDIYSKTEQKPKDLFGSQEQTLLDEKLFDKLTKKIHKFYGDTTGAQKQSDKDEIKSLIRQIINGYLDAKKAEYAAREKDFMLSKESNKKKIADAMGNLTDNILTAERILTEMLKNNFQTKELFLYKLFFGEVLREGGFDIVIGNPPYIRQEKIKELKPKLEIEKYQSYNGTADIYVYFFEQGYRLLKEDGVLSFITSNKYTRAKYGKEFRDFVLKNTQLLEYIDFNGVKVFESATVDTSILSFKKTKKSEKFLYCDIGADYKGEELRSYCDKNGFGYSQSDLSAESFTFANPKELKVKKRIEEIGTPLKEWDIKIYRGILTGFNEAFTIDSKIRDELVAKDPKSAEIIKPMLRGRDIKRYSYEWAGYWLINVHNNPPIKIDEYPAVKEHLDGYYPQLAKRLDQGVTPYNLRNCAYWQEFESEKLLWADLSRSGNSFVYDDKKMFLQNTGYIMTGRSLKYLNAILDSKLILYYFDSINQKLDETGWRWINQYVERLPIPQISEPDQKPFEVLVDYIIFAKANALEMEAKFFESVIDVMVYGLYFEESMKKADCFINDEVKLLLENCTDIKEAYKVFKENKTVMRGLTYSRTVEEVKIINGAKDD